MGRYHRPGTTRYPLFTQLGHWLSMAHKRQPNSRMPETALYGPVKCYLEALGFTVKGEVCGCDLVALRGDEPPMVVIGELKLAFSLDLVLQAVDRTAACDKVWLAVSAAGRGRLRDPRVRKLCRFWFRIARSIVRWRGRSACGAQAVAPAPRQETPCSAGL